LILIGAKDHSGVASTAVQKSLESEKAWTSLCRERVWRS
jgi:hypothetical protein